MFSTNDILSPRAPIVNPTTNLIGITVVADSQRQWRYRESNSHQKTQAVIHFLKGGKDILPYMMYHKIINLPDQAGLLQEAIGPNLMGQTSILELFLMKAAVGRVCFD